MAHYFEISNNIATLKLDSQGRGTVQYKVKNVSAAPVDGRAVLISLPALNPPVNAVQKGWVRLDASSDHHFEKDEQTVFSVKIEVPQKERAQGGTYTFRLDAVLVSIPDRGDEGPATAFTVEAAEKPKPNMLAWLIPLIVVLVAAIGIGLWLALRGSSSTVPDVTGKPVGEAVATLTGQKFKVDPTITTVTDAGADPNKVFSTTPVPGAKAAEGTTVHLAVGSAKKPTVPVTTTTGSTPPVQPQANCAYGPGTCTQGYVFREANASDRVCVTPAVRAQTLGDNAQAIARRNPSGGAYGPDTCLVGFVWRGAFANDHVCVPGQTRDQAAQDNAAAASRIACH